MIRTGRSRMISRSASRINNKTVKIKTSRISKKIRTARTAAVKTAITINGRDNPRKGRNSRNSPGKSSSRKKRTHPKRVRVSRSKPEAPKTKHRTKRMERPRRPPSPNTTRCWTNAASRP